MRFMRLPTVRVKMASFPVSIHRVYRKVTIFQGLRFTLLEDQFVPHC